MAQKLSWIFFDIGSTLVDEHFVYERIFRKIAEHANRKYEDIYSEAIELYKQNKKGDVELEKKYGLPRMKWRTEAEVLYKYVPECLEILSAGYKIGIIANQPAGTQGRLEKRGLLKYIDLVIASAEEGVCKPDPGIFELALQRAKCRPCDAAMIGDRIDNDIVPAKRLGMHTIWLRQGFGGYWNVTGDEETAEFVAENISEVCGYLRG